MANYPLNYSGEDIKSAIGRAISGGEIDKNLLDHIADKKNPHKLTADQIDVYSKSETYGKNEVYNKNEVDNALQLKSNENLLDNWYFINPINQRENTIYTGQGYTIDRWRTYRYNSCTTTLMSNGLQVAGDVDFGQTIEQSRLPTDDFFDITISVLTADNTFYTASGHIDNTILNQSVVIIAGDWNFSYINKWNTAEYALAFFGVYGKSVTPKAVKLELGTQQTLAHQNANGIWVLNDPPPNRSIELEKCQRYYLKASSQNNLGTISTGIYYSNISCAVFTIPIPTTMRDTPTLETPSTGSIVDTTGTTFFPTDWHVDKMDPGGVRIFASNLSGLATGPVALDGFLWVFSAEL